ncbi:hypothetical protein J4211_06045 [Candidatus Woesearchaeota archaeon]|nr:hypothetical protein [Candidatus Woesearchaeota archaeon]
MKRVMCVVLLLLASCVQPYQGNQTTVTVLNISNTTVAAVQNQTVEPSPLIQCPDGTFVSSVKECEEHQVTETNSDFNGTIAHKLLQQAREKFTNHAYVLDDALVIFSGNKSRYYFAKLSDADGVPITDVYIDREAKTALAYCNLDREARLYDASFDYERSKCREYPDAAINVSFEEWNPKGPLDFLEEFENDTPVLVENTFLTMSIGGNSKTIQPSVHYENEGKEVILRIDKRYHVPAKVEIEGEPPIDFRDTYFDLMVVDGKQERITSDWVVYKNISEYWLKGNTK